ncbi:hypothetical protein PIB30_044970 [Stylosanthes scabra]|uniref:Uncharacterized protein n=1 Tax=Stylosanthes scabra TaxID=79078 RepID=A0ABU6UHU6_9FABA|nr:hypothetical protein [Stylosanthes scabra]
MSRSLRKNNHFERGPRLLLLKHRNTPTPPNPPKTGCHNTLTAPHGIKKPPTLPVLSDSMRNLHTKIGAQNFPNVPCGRIYWSDVQVTFSQRRGRTVAWAALKFEGQKGNFKSSGGL